MSQENVELVRSAIEAFNREDFRRLTEVCDEDFEFVSVMTALEETSYRGRNTWETYYNDMHETWEEWQVEDLRVFDGGDDRVAAVMRLVGTGRSSGVPVEATIGIAYRIRKGKLWRARSYLDPGEALEALGLSE
jgi:ketosteroid isomerase-like protein